MERSDPCTDECDCNTAEWNCRQTQSNDVSTVVSEKETARSMKQQHRLRQQRLITQSLRRTFGLVPFSAGLKIESFVFQSLFLVCLLACCAFSHANYGSNRAHVNRAQHDDSESAPTSAIGAGMRSSKAKRLEIWSSRTTEKSI